jgi:hypothetical protein
LSLRTPTISKVLKREGLKPMRASPSVHFATLEPDIRRELKKPAGVNDALTSHRPDAVGHLKPSELPAAF